MPLQSTKTRVFLPLFSAVFLSDCVSKRVAVDQLSPPYVPHDVMGDVVRFTLAYNVRAAMGLSAGSASRWILAGIATVMLVVLCVWLMRTRRNDPVLFSGIALVAAGALGNLVDRVRWDRGVVDFIDVGFGSTRFWIFNVADMAITIGAVVLWIASRNPRPAPPSDADDLSAASSPA
jgi:signal peptidase II